MIREPISSEFRSCLTDLGFTSKPKNQQAGVERLKSNASARRPTLLQVNAGELRCFAGRRDRRCVAGDCDKQCCGEMKKPW